MDIKLTINPVLIEFVADRYNVRFEDGDSNKDKQTKLEEALQNDLDRRAKDQATQRAALDARVAKREELDQIIPPPDDVNPITP